MSDYLPEEILIEILVKLPAKSLIRATSVCKPWRSLIRSPSFISAHLSSSENQALLRRYDIHKAREHYTVFPKRGPFGIKSSELDFPFKCPIGYFRIVGSCDGLVCLSNDLFTDPSPPVILNPAIRNHVVLPKSLVNPNEPHLVVLGFGVASNVYKVVRLVYCRNDYGFIAPPQAEIFSLGTGRWRKLSGIDVRIRLLEYVWCPIFFKGFVYWIGYQRKSENNDCNSILSFHFGDEVFGEIMFPEELEREDVTSLSLAIMGESLGAITINGEIGDLRCDVWMMKDHGVNESWTRLYRIDCEGFQRVIGFWGSGEALLAVHGFELVTYNAETKLIKHVEVFGNTRSFYVGDYKESLVLLGGYRGDSGEELSRGVLEGMSLGAA
ncbi:hypothetical protein ACS0TY_020992 [Phlomoides rotata]